MALKTSGALTKVTVRAPVSARAVACASTKKASGATAGHLAFGDISSPRFPNVPLPMWCCAALIARSFRRRQIRQNSATVRPPRFGFQSRSALSFRCLFKLDFRSGVPGGRSELLITS